MSFKKRAINVRFVLNNGDTLADSESDSIGLSNHRCEAIITNVGGQLAPQVMQLRIFGMKLSDMNKFSTDGLNALAVRGDQVTLSAGDDGDVIRQVFNGTINAAFIDYSSAPDVSFNVSAVAGGFYQIKPAQPNSYKGYVDVASIIEGLAKSIGFAFENNGVSAQVCDQYLAGTAIDQIKAVVDAARIACCIENGVVSIFPNGGSKGDDVVELSPDAGMVGYPSFTRSGIMARSVFNPDISYGKKVRVTSSVEKACGEWFIHKVSHELSTLMPGGPWFSICELSKASFYAPAF